MESPLTRSFQGGVEPGRAGRGEVRARVAVQGSNIEALTGDETFRIPIARCSLARDGKKIVARDEQGALVIWSDDDGFLDALAQAQRGTLKDQVERIRAAARRRRALGAVAKGLIVAGALFAASGPVTRWAVRGGVPTIAGRLGEAALSELDLPSGVAPAVEQQLGAIAEQLRPACSPSTASFRVLLAGYGEVHSFGLPPDAVVVTAGLVCGADEPGLVAAAVARELAHLENRHVNHHVAEGVEWYSALDLLLGGGEKLRDRMLDFADPKRSPGFTPAQEAAADEQALAMLMRVRITLVPGQDLAALLEQLKQPPAAGAGDGQTAPGAGKKEAPEWAKAQAEACSLIGH